MSPISLQDFGAALAALSALATAAFGLLDSTKAFWGGISNIGLGAIWSALAPYAEALDAALGRDGWRRVVRANWLNGVAKDDQKARVRALVRLGFTPQTAPILARATYVDPETLVAAARRIGEGEGLDERQMNAFGRMNAAIEAHLDAAFERADQAYRNISRLAAGVLAIALSVAAQEIWRRQGLPNPPSLAAAVLVGVVAVPIAPVAKDLSSALSAAMQALKATRGA